MTEKIAYQSPYALYQMHQDIKDNDSPVTVFLHGGPGFNNIAERRIFSAALMPSFNLLWFDQLGCYNSPVKTPEGISLDNTLRDMAGIFSLFGDRGVNLVSFCVATQVAHHFTERFPELVRNVVLISPTVDTGKVFQRLVEIHARNGTLVLNEKTHRDFDTIVNTPSDQYGMEQLLALGNIVRHVPQWNDIYWHNKTAMENYYQLSGAYGISLDVFFAVQNELFAKKIPDLKTIYKSKKVLIVQGDQDQIVDWAWHGRLIQDAVPHATVKFLPKAGHWAHIENIDAFLTVLREFCAAPAPSG